jgi:hypothetical protein
MFNEISMEIRSEFEILIITKAKARKVNEALRMAVNVAGETLWWLAQVATQDLMNEEKEDDQGESLDSALATEFARFALRMNHQQHQTNVATP